MRPLYLKVVLFDPFTDDEYPVSEGIKVEIVRIYDNNPLVGFDRLPLKYDRESDLFIAKAPGYKVSESHYLRVGFKMTRFSKESGQLEVVDKANPAPPPIFCPSRLPAWDSGWDDNYETNEYFDEDDLIVITTPDAPLHLRIPLRQIYIIGHRGAPYHFPENTMASFAKALELGANGLEFDICLTKDKRLIVFHDPQPVKHPSQMDRTIFEGFPFELISPDFSMDGSLALIKNLFKGKFKIIQRIRMRSEDQLNIINLNLNQIRRHYHYQPVDQVEHEIPELNDLLDFASRERKRLQLLFFDIKNPDWDEDDGAARYVAYGRYLARELKKFSALPARLVICNASQAVLGYLKKGILAEGEQRCEFSFDAQGSFGALFGFKKDPLKIARKMGNSVISIGSLFRPGSLGEITEATRDRDYNAKSKLSTVIHWTINEQAQMYNSFTAGVNGIVTDKPEEFKKLLKKLKI
jgi:glycerophosphoryl diester phosphodiesterase